MKRDRFSELINLVDPATAYILSCWANWLRGGEVTRGYPRTSAGFLTGGINCYDDLEESVNDHIAATASVIVQSMRETPRRMILAVWTGSVFPTVADLQAATLEAVAEFEKAARVKGLL